MNTSQYWFSAAAGADLGEEIANSLKFDASGYLTRAQSSSGDGLISSDRTFIEEDSNTRYKALTAFDTVSEVQAVIAEGVGAFTSGANRLMFAHYDYVEGTDTAYAIINAADFTGISTSSNLAETENFKVVGIATLAGVAEGALGTLGGYNLTATKNSGLHGA